MARKCSTVSKPVVYNRETTKVFIACDPSMQATLNKAIRAASSNVSILITGETGTGKEVMARYIHANSPRATKPFVAVNCAAIPEQLLESELFGHERGSFSGAFSQRIGKLEASHQGTLLLDEVSEMDRLLQAKLLRAIQEREIDRIGGVHPVPVDIRLIATTNRDIFEEMEHDRFRKDLFFRLAVVSIHVPRLKDHPKDIIPLAEYFLARFCSNNQKLSLSDRAKETLTNYSWPGNIRELENTMQRAIVMSCGDVICDKDLELQHTKALDVCNFATEHQNVAGRAPRRLLAEVERDVIINTLNSTNGNRTEASRILGLSVRTLRNKINVYAVEGHELPYYNARLSQ